MDRCPNGTLVLVGYICVTTQDGAAIIKLWQQMIAWAQTRDLQLADVFVDIRRGDRNPISAEHTVLNRALCYPGIGGLLIPAYSHLSSYPAERVQLESQIRRLKIELFTMEALDVDMPS